MIRAVLILLLAAMLAPFAAAEEKFDIKLKKEAKGDVIQVTGAETDKRKSSTTVMGVTQETNKDSTSSVMFREEIVEKQPEKRPTKSKRVYQKADLTLDGTKLGLSLIGKEITIARDGKKAEFTIDGKEVAGDNRVFVENQLQDSSQKGSHFIDLIWPKQPVALNSVWNVDMDAVAKDALDDGISINVASSSGAGKLLKTYKKDGKQYGVIDVDIKLALAKVGGGPSAIEFDATSISTVHLRFDGCIDGSSRSGIAEMAVEIRMSYLAKTPDNKDEKIEFEAKKKKTSIIEDLMGKK